MGLPFQGHKDNHAGLMTKAQMETWRETQKIAPGREWDKYEGLDIDGRELDAFLAETPFMQAKQRRLKAPAIPVPEALDFAGAPAMSTQQGFGLDAERTCALGHAACRAHRHDLA